MAKRNRKNGHHGSRVLYWGIPLMVLLFTLGMVYLHLHSVSEGIGREITRLEREQNELRKRLVNEERNWVVARSLRNMEALMEQHGIVMSFPEEPYIVRVKLQDVRDPAMLAYRDGTPRRD